MTRARDLASGQNGIRPFAMECGATSLASIVGGSTSTTATITYTVGRFTQTPMFVGVTNNAFNSVFWPLTIRSQSSSSIAVAAGGASSPGSSGMTAYWHAVQMTSSNGAG